MATLTRLTANDLVAVMAGFRDGLRAHKERVNRLNVYPVPDGDTGTNMSLTLDSVCDGVSAVDASDMPAVCQAISRGSLMGARGNSGVILSQILRALADGCKAAPPDGAGGLEFAHARALGNPAAADGFRDEGDFLVAHLGPHEGDGRRAHFFSQFFVVICSRQRGLAV